MHRLCGVSWRALVVLAVLLTAGASRAATYYVATTGNDADAGSQATPWRTLQKAGNVAVAGDTVNVLPGTYAGFRPLHSGTAPAPIRFVAQAGVIVNTPGTANSNGDNIWVRDVDYIVIDGFESTAAPRSGVAVQGEPDGNAAGVVIRNCNCHHNSRWGIFTGFARDLLLEDNETSFSAIEHGIYVSNSGDRPIVRRNHAHHNNASGVQLNADPAQMGDDPNDPEGDGIIEGAVVESNLIHDNGTAGGAAINLASVRTSLIRNNVLYGNHASGIAGWDDGDGNEFGTMNNRILGNTIVQPSGSRFAIGLLNGSTGNLIRDNILLHLGTRGSISADPTSQPGLSSDYNVVVDRFSDDTCSSPSHSGAASASTRTRSSPRRRRCSSTRPPTTTTSRRRARRAMPASRTRTCRWIATGSRDRRAVGSTSALTSAPRSPRRRRLRPPPRRCRRPPRRRACRSRCRARCRHAAARRCRR